MKNNTFNVKNLLTNEQTTIDAGRLLDYLDDFFDPKDEHGEECGCGCCGGDECCDGECDCDHDFDDEDGENEHCCHHHHKECNKA